MVLLLLLGQSDQMFKQIRYLSLIIFHHYFNFNVYLSFMVENNSCILSPLMNKLIKSDGISEVYYFKSGSIIKSICIKSVVFLEYIPLLTIIILLYLTKKYIRPIALVAEQKFTDKREVRRHRDCVICQICLKMAYLTVNEVK